MSTIESRPFYFCEYSLYSTDCHADRTDDVEMKRVDPPITCREDERDWLPINIGGELGAVPPSDPNEMPYMCIPDRAGDLPRSDDVDAWQQQALFGPGKYLYVFRWERDSKNGTLYGTYLADASHKLSFFVEASARSLATQPNLTPIPSPTGEVTRLVHTINGKSIRYSFIASRIALTKDAIADLERQWPPMIPVLDLSKKEHFAHIQKKTLEVRDEQTNEIKKVEIEIGGVVGFVDPVTIANNLQIRYTMASDAHIKFVNLTPDHTANERHEFLRRGKKVMLANILRQIEDPQHAQDNDYVGGTAAVGEYIKKYEEDVYDLIKEEGRWSLSLARWLNSSLMTRVLGWYQKHPNKKLYENYVGLFSDWCRRLAKGEAGRRLLGQWMDNKPHVVSTFVLPDPGDPAGSTYEVTRKTLEAVVTLATDFLPVYLLKHKPAGISDFAAALKLTTRMDFVSVVPFTEYVPKPVKKKRRGPRTRTEYIPRETLATVTIRLEPGPDATAKKLHDWLRADPESKTAGKPARILTAIFAIIELGNLWLGAKDAFGALSAEDRTMASSARAIIGFLGSLADTVGALSLLRKLGEKTVARFALIAAMADCIMAFWAASDAHQSDDHDAAAGQWIIFAGSFGLFTLSAATVGVMVAEGMGVGGAVAADAAVAAWATPVTAFAVTVIAAGTIIYTFTIDSDIEQFAKHCEFGIALKKKSTTKPKWSDTTFAEWSHPETGLTAQLRALISLLGAFTVESIGEAAVRIRFGLLLPSSELLIEFECELFEHPARRKGAVLDVVGEGKTVNFRPWYKVDIDSGNMNQFGGDHGRLDLIRCGNDEKGRFVEVTAQPRDESGTPNYDLCDHVRASCKVKLVFPGDSIGARHTVPTSGMPVSHLIHDLVDGPGSETRSFD